MSWAHFWGTSCRVAPAAERNRGDFFLNSFLFGKSLGLHANRGGAEGTDRDWRQTEGGQGGPEGENAPKGPPED